MEVTIRLSIIFIGISNGQANVTRKLLVTFRQIENLRKAFANNLSANLNYQKLNYLK